MCNIIGVQIDLTQGICVWVKIIDLSKVTVITKPYIALPLYYVSLALKRSFCHRARSRLKSRNGAPVLITGG